MSLAHAPRNSFGTTKTLTVKGRNYLYHSLAELTESGYHTLDRLPYSIKLLLENLLRHEDGVNVTNDDIDALINWRPNHISGKEIFFTPSRVLLQDFTGVPAIADLAAMRNAIGRLGGKPEQINPFTHAELVIDHSVQVDHYGSIDALSKNTELDFERNRERYQFLKWGQQAFNNFRVVPPDSGIVHQINLEHLSSPAMTKDISGHSWIFPDSVIGIDSHTTMINGLGILGWGVGGIEAEAALLGQPGSILIPQVVGVRLYGDIPVGVTATDIVLTLTEALRKHDVTGACIEFFGPGLTQLSLTDRATIANMAPECGANCGFFPIDKTTSDYLRLTNRHQAAELAEAYYLAQGLWHDGRQENTLYSDVIEFDLGLVEPCLAGPSRPQDRVLLPQVRSSFRKCLVKHIEQEGVALDKHQTAQWLYEGGNFTIAPELEQDNSAPSNVLNLCSPVRPPDGVSYNLCHGSVVIAAITSCTNTANPSLMMAAGLLARNAVKRGLQIKPWVKTSLTPGSKVVSDYLTQAGLMPYLEALRFHVTGYGCATCIGNSGRLSQHVSQAIRDANLNVAAILSGNRNFEGRVNAMVKANYLASPPMVVAYALAGNLNMDLTKDPLGVSPNGEFIYLRDIWPSPYEVETAVQQHVTQEQFKQCYKDIFAGEENWNQLTAPEGELFPWQHNSTYIKEPPFFNEVHAAPPGLKDIVAARVLLKLGDSVSTDYISPAGSIPKESCAGQYLIKQGINPRDFNSYGSRRGNHEVMMRGTFASSQLTNELAPETRGGITLHFPSNKQLSVFDAAVEYKKSKTPLVILAGKNYGMGSSRDWAAKGTQLLGVRAVIFESIERTHRSNLVGMGVLPLQFLEGQNAQTLNLTGEERFDIVGIPRLSPARKLTVAATNIHNQVIKFEVIARVDSNKEVEYIVHGGILPYVLRQTIKD